MARLPKPGGDDGTWGDILNNYLEQQHNDDGSHKSTAVPDADSTTKGKLKLTGDLGGTADSPSVPDLASKYEKPGGGIPKSDLSSGVQGSLDTADARDAAKLRGTNVSSSAPSDGQVLTFDNTSTSWKPADAPAGTPASTVTDETTYGVAKATGSSTHYAREDHTHGSVGHDGHANLTGVTSDQHHAKSHVHDGADGSGTVAHSATTGITANDHHNQSHANTDHTTTGTPGDSAVGDSAAQGSSASIARLDHKHGREAFGSPVAVGTSNADGSATTLPRSDHQHQGAGLAGNTFTSEQAAPDFKASGLTGATAASRYVGATASGAPASGTFAKGDYVIDQTGAIWVCTTAGTPGTWTEAGNAPAFATPALTLGTSNANGSANSIIRSDATIQAFDGTNPTTSAVADAAATGSAAVAARRDHKHGREAFGSAGYPQDVAATKSDGTATTLARSDHAHAHGSGYLPDAHHNQSHADSDHTGANKVGVGTAASAGGTFSLVGTRAQLALVNGDGISVAVTDDSSNGKVDAAITLASRNPTPNKTNGVLGWVFDPLSISTTTNAIAAATLTYSKIMLPVSISLTNVLFELAVVGTGADTHCFGVGWKSDGTLIGQTADQASDWSSGGATGLKTLALSGGPFTVTSSGPSDFIWVGVYCGTVAGTGPKFRGNSTPVGATLNVGLSASAYRFATKALADTGTMGSITPSANAIGSHGMWAAIS